jgi:hypothetical protein
LFDVIAVIVRRPVRGDDEVAGRHVGLFAFDRGIGALAVEHEANGRRDVAMGRRDLARHDHLDAGKHRVGDLRFTVQGRIFQDQNAALGFLGGDQAAGFHDQRFDIVEMPDMRNASGHRLLGDDVFHHLPQRRHVLLGDALVEGLRIGLDIVLGIVGIGLCRGSNRHGILH